MERKHITCPDSGHLEEIEYEPTPYGLVIVGCSRFEPRCAVECACECARRLDRKHGVEESRDRVLVVFSRATWTRPVASALAELLVRDGLVVDLADADAGAPPPPADYDAVVIGSPQRLGRRARSILDYVSHHHAELAGMPAFWFCVGDSELANPGRIRRATGWMPTRSFAIVRPGWETRWFGDPDAWRAPSVHALALAVGEDIPARELSD